MSEPAPLIVAELFTSLQGEGARAGRCCAFIRLAGCNLSCAWCDTGYTWQPGVATAADRVPRTLDELLAWVDAQDVDLVEITGGEPLLQRGVYDLLAALCDRGYETILDTSGSLGTADVDPRVRLALDLKCPGSGQSARMDWSNVERLRPERDEVKFVLADADDYAWAAARLAEHRLHERALVIFSPVMPLAWAGDMASWPLAADVAAWMLRDRCPATLQLQLHRLLWPLALRGTDEAR